MSAPKPAPGDVAVARASEDSNQKPAARSFPSLREHMDLPKSFVSPYASSSRGTSNNSDYDSLTDDEDAKPAAIDMDADVRLAVALQQEEFIALQRLKNNVNSKDEACNIDELLALSLKCADDDDDEDVWMAKIASKFVSDDDDTEEDDDDDREAQIMADAAIAKAMNKMASKYVSDDEDTEEEEEEKQAQIMADAAFAKAIAESFEPLDEDTRKLIEEYEKEAMFETVSGRATLFVQAVLELAASTEATLPANVQANLRAVNRDDMVYLAERLLKAQEKLETQNRDTCVDVGYHYTKSEECMTRIRVDGLMTHTERDAAGIPKVFNGASFGEGIYTGNNPTSYSSYGPIGVMVARLKGTTTISSATPKDQADTVIGRRGAMDEIVVLRNSRHCLPLIEYDTSLASTYQNILASLEQDLQALISTYLRVVPKVDSDQGSAKFPSVKIAAFNLPDNLTYTAPSMLDTDPMSATTPAGSSPEECPICLASLSQSVVALNYCGHKFHRECLLDSTRAGQRSCAICRKLYQEPQGLCPSGTLTVSYSSSQACSGFSAGIITLDYNIPNGIQQSYHPSPGVSYAGATRQAFLPDNQEGRELLKRLKYAFTRGLTFTVGTSLTNGTPNCVTWASVHHKTALSGGPHGFPDSSYFANCHCELDSVGVPAADEFQ